MYLTDKKYKNCKNFINLCHHEEHFGSRAEWNFFSTSHGKGPCDGVRGTVKRLVARSNLQRPYSDQILTPIDFYLFCCPKIEGIKFSYTTFKDYEDEVEFLSDRFSRACTIAGTQKLHYFEPVSPSTLLVKLYSSAKDFMLKNVCKDNCRQSVQSQDINGYLTVVYNSHWYLACVLEKNAESKEVTVSFLHPPGPANSFMFPQRSDILLLPFSDILTTASPTTQTGRTYQLDSRTQEDASAALAEIN